MTEDLNDKIKFELVSPEEKLASEDVHMVVCPGEEGDFASLDGASSILSSLKPGVVSLYKDSQENAPRRIFISGGFADVNARQCTVLAEQAYDVASLEKSEIEQTIRNLQEDLSLASDKREINKIHIKLDVEKARLEAVLGKALVSL